MSWSIRWGQLNHRVLIRGREKVRVREGGHEPRNAGSLSKLENILLSIRRALRVTSVTSADTGEMALPRKALRQPLLSNVNPYDM